MLRHIAGFELRHQLRQPFFWAIAAGLAVLAFISTTTGAIEIGGPIGSLNRNAPYVVVRLIGALGLLGIFTVVSFVATSALRDFDLGTHELVFSRPICPRDLWLGRFIGSLAAVGTCFTFGVLGLVVGAFMPWLDPETMGPFQAWSYFYGVGVIAFPNFAILGALFFAVASRVRHLGATYVALVVLLVASFVAGAMFTDAESRTTAALLDPFGLAAFERATRYWTIAEKNSRLPSLTGELLLNRALWLGIGFSALAWAITRFRYDQAVRRRSLVPSTSVEVSLGPTKVRMRERPAFTRRAAWVQLGSLFAVEARAIILSLPFLLILAFSLVNVIANIGYIDLMAGTPVWPVTYLMLVAIRAGYSFLLAFSLMFYAGEAVWRERNRKLDGVFDVVPTPTWVRVAAKLLALWTAATVFIAAGMVALMGFQLYRRYTYLEPGLYAEGLVAEVFPFLLIATLALAAQAALNHKLAAHLVMVLHLLSSMALAAFHFEHYLYRFPAVPRGTYSDLNGWGHFVTPMFWFMLYWSCAAGLLVCLTYLAWVRGADTGWRPRWRAARTRLRGPVRTAVAVLAVAFVATGAFIFYNTNVLNEYLSSDEVLRRTAEYEKTYGLYANLPQPRITSIRAEVDIFPRERRFEIRGTYRLVNRSSEPVSALHVSIPPAMTIRRLDLPPHRVKSDDRRLGYAVYDLETPLAPGGEITFAFDLERTNPGFVASNSDNSVVENGTFLHNGAAFPSLGYDRDRLLTDPSERRRQGLPPAARMEKIDDTVARMNHVLAKDSDWVDFETTVSTSSDQIAIACGDLQREWTAGGRRYFHYKMATPIPKLFGYLSARYAVRRDSWKGVGIEVFHHPQHAYNVDRMVGAIQKTLAYMTENFSPYQHAHIRVVEFPRFVRGAVSLPNTIPFSESIGFISRLTDPDAIDYPFYVTAHEVAHQWWGYQVMPAGVQGSTFVSETMAQYSALMVMEKEYGPDKMRRFLAYELDRYLSGRGGETLEEMPLALVENQPYIHYSKGSLAMYALKDYLGEDALNAALRRYVAAVRFAPAPYTVSRDLLSFVAAAVPAGQERLLDDLFESITLFDLQAVDAVSRVLPDGRYEVSLTLKARKLRADGRGVESEVALDDWIDVGILGPSATLYLEKHHVTGPELTVQVVVDGRPTRAGIDPYAKLVDRTPADNVRSVAQR